MPRRTGWPRPGTKGGPIHRTTVHRLDSPTCARAPQFCLSMNMATWSWHDSQIAIHPAIPAKFCQA